MMERTLARIALVWLVLGACTFVALRAPLLSLPLERDEGEYAYIAWRMAEGDVPYRDAFDQKPPAIFIVYRVAFALFGQSPEAIRIFFGLWSVFTAAALYGLVRCLAGPLAGAGAVLVFCALGADPRLGAAAANTEAFLGLPCVLALWLCLGGGVGAKRVAGALAWVGAGVASAVAVAFKQVALTNAAFIVVLAGLLPGANGTRRIPLRIAAFCGGALAVVLPIVWAFVAVGAFEPFADAVWFHNLEYAGRRSVPQGFSNLRYALGEQAPSLAPVWVLAVVGLLGSVAAGGRERAVLAGWLGASLLGVAVGLQFRPHYFLQALPALAAAAGVGLAAAVRVAGASGVRAAAGVAAVLALAVVGAPALANRAVLTAETPHAAAREIWGLNPFPEAVTIARHIARTSQPDETVFVVGSEPEILFYAGRRSATRYIFFYPLTGGYPGARARQREAWDEVTRARPGYVVWVHVPTSWLMSDDTDPWIFQEAGRMLSRDYAIESVAHPDEAGDDYVFVHGRAALRWLETERGRLEQLPWVAVYRRESAPQN